MGPPNEKPPPWWQETWVLTRAIFGILLWPLLALVAVVVAIAGLVVAFGAGWPWGLLALAIIALAVAAFAWWDRRRTPPQG
jgi:lysylphosphatidylglycerol synthetase-like protein (DUF2156 family)